MLYAGAAEHPVASPDPICSGAEGRMKGNPCDGLGMAEEGARGSISLAWPATTPIPSPLPPGKQHKLRTVFVSTDLSAQKGLVQALIWLQAGEGPVPCCPGTQAGRSAPHQAPLEGETFLAQVKRENFYRSPQQTQQFK